jgi:hypothetical protein
VKRIALATALAALATAAPVRALASIVHMAAQINTQQEVPSPGGGGHGFAVITVDTDANTLTYHVEIAGLSSPEIGAHIHGPAVPGEVSFTYLHFLPLGNVKDGVWNYSEDLEPDILAGRTYINCHTQVNQTGEIRGQIVASLPLLNRVATWPLALALLVVGALFSPRAVLTRRGTA